MCITLTNAVDVGPHVTTRDGVRPYTRTRHNPDRIEPGDWIRPFWDEYPRIVVEVHRGRTYVRIGDHYGAEFRYRHNQIVSTAVPDPLRLNR